MLSVDGIAARRIVAVMEDVQPVNNRPVHALPGNAMSPDRPASDREYAIAGVIGSPGPFETSVRLPLQPGDEALLNSRELDEREFPACPLALIVPSTQLTDDLAATPTAVNAANLHGVHDFPFACFATRELSHVMKPGTRSIGIRKPPSVTRKMSAASVPYSGVRPAT